MNKAILHTALHCLTIGFIVLLLTVIDSLREERMDLTMSLFFAHQYTRVISEACAQRSPEGITADPFPPNIERKPHTTEH